MVIYVVERSGDYGSNMIGAFSSRERAIAVIEHLLKFYQDSDTYAVYEMEVDNEHLPTLQSEYER